MSTIRIHIPTPLRKLTSGLDEVSVELSKAGEGTSLQDAITGLDAAHNGFAERLMQSDGKLRGFLKLYINEDYSATLEGLQTPLKDGDAISITMALAGG